MQQFRRMFFCENNDEHRIIQKHTSPAPRNKNLWSAKFPPTNFKAATKPARTTDAVPWNKSRYNIRDNHDTSFEHCYKNIREFNI